MPLPLDPVGDTLEQLGAAPSTTVVPGQAPAPPTNAGGSTFDAANAFLQQQQQEDETRIRRTTRVGESPDDAVAASRLARRYNLPTPVVSQNLQRYREQAQCDDANEAAKQNPRLGAWMAADPANAAIAGQDLKPLSALERAIGIGRNIAGSAAAGVMDFSQGIWGAVQAAAENTGTAPSAEPRRAGQLGPEDTPLQPADEKSFQAWAKSNRITDVDDPRSHYDYRGFWLSTQGADHPPGSEEHFPDTFKQHGHPTFSIESQYSQGGRDGGHWDGDTFIPPEPNALAQFAHGASLVAKHLADKLRGEQAGAGFIERAAYSGVESIGNMVPGLVAAAATGGSGLLLTAAGVGTGGQAYTDAREQGVTPKRALTFGAVQGAIEVGTEFLPAHLLIGDVKTHARLVTMLAHQVASEIPGEEIATALQDLNEWAFLPANKDRTFNDYLNERPSAAAATAISVLVSIGGTAIGTHGAVRVMEQMGLAAKESPTVTKSPDAVEAFLKHAAEGAGDATFYAPVDVWTTYWQEKGADPAVVAASVTGNPQAYAKAQEAGLLEIPASRYAVTLAGSEHNTFFENELTLSPDLMNARELKAFGDQQLAQADAQANAEPTRRQVVEGAITEQLTAGGQFRAQDAQSIAQLHGAAFGTLAEAAGVDPLEVYDRYGLVVARPDIGTQGPAQSVPRGTTVQEVGESPEAVQAIEQGKLSADQVNPSLKDQAASVEVVNEPAAGTVPNASGESAASAESMSRDEGMKARGERFVYFDRAGNEHPAHVDFVAKPGQTFGILREGGGFQTLDDQGGKVKRYGEGQGPGRKPVTPQLPPPLPASAYVPAFKPPKKAKQAVPTGTPAEVYRALKRDLTKAEKSGDPAKVIAEVERFNKYYEQPDAPPFPDDWSRWERAKGDAELALERATRTAEAPADVRSATSEPVAKPEVTPAVEEEPAPTLPAVEAPQAAAAEALNATVTDTHVETPLEEAQNAASGEVAAEADVVDGGATLGARDSGEPARRPGDDRAQELAGQQSEPAAVLQPEQKEPKRRGKRGAPKGGRDVRGGAATPSARPEPGTSGGAHPASHVDTADAEPDAVVADAHARAEQPRHYQIDSNDSLTEGGWVAKLDDNLGAIRLLKELERLGRKATDAEQAVLARYIGWGHTNLAPVVDLRAGATDTRDPRVQKARAELEQLLTKKELQELGESTANAHYSFNDLPRAMWAAVQRLGFKGGTILEPAVGTGHFLGTMPGDVLAKKSTRTWAVEKEPIAAAIAAQLYQDAHVQNSPLQEANLPNDYFDLVISNVPFGRIPIFDPEFTSAARKPIAASVHNYYFGKALDTVRPGGIIAFVTSRYTMDARSDVVRQFLAQRADLLGAVRLPDQAFKKTAGTDVVTDVIFLQKRAEGVEPKGERWTESSLHEGLSVAQTPIYTNEYFQRHPDHVLGTEDTSGKMARSYQPQYNVSGTLEPGQLLEALSKALPASVYRASQQAPRKLAAVISRDVKQGAFQIDNGKLFVYDKGTLAPSDLKGVHAERAMAFVPVRDAYQTVLDTMVNGGTDAALKKAQRALFDSYQAFVKLHGLVNEPANRRVIENDPNGGRVLALEDVELVRRKGRPAEVKLKGHASIFTERTIVPVTEATQADSPSSALTQSLAWRGGVDLAYMSGLTGTPETELASALEGEIYRDPATGAYFPAAEYLSGDVTTKLAQAQAAAQTDAAYAGNVTALEKVLPRQFSAEDFPVPFGATWVPLEIYNQFVADELHNNAGIVTLVNTENRVKFYVEGFYGKHEFLPEGADPSEWVGAALNGELPQIRTRASKDSPSVVDQAATDTYRESLAQLREKWAEWWPGHPTAAPQLVKIYNAMFNREAAYVADGSHLVLPNANPSIKLRKWQKNVVWRALQTGNTLIAHAVGAGKTFAMTGIAGEWKRLGLANKPMIVVPNHLTEQWRREFLAMYPQARLLVPAKEDFSPGNRAKLIARIANNDWDAVVMAQSQFMRVSVKLETLKAFIEGQEAQLLADGAAQLGISTEDFNDLVTGYGAGDKDSVRRLSGRDTPRSAKDIARGILTLRARLEKRLNQAKKDAPVTFEELGVDGLLIDEAHLYKNLYFSTAMNGIAGLKGSDADRAMDMFLKVRNINEASKGRNVVFATGTPVSNAISELYTMFRYLAQPTLDRMGMAGFDSWAHGNAEARAEMEPAPGGGYKERTRLRKWSNLRELSSQFRKFADVVTTDDLIKSGAVKLPKVKGGSPTVIALDAHPDMPAFMEELNNRIEELKTGKVNPKDDNHLLINTQASLAAIDLRLVKDVPEDPNGRIPVMAREIAQRYTATKATKGVQIVFLDIGVPNAKSMPALPASLRSGGAAVTEPITGADEQPGDEGDDIVNPEEEAEAAMDTIRSAGKMRDLYGELRRLLVAQGIKDDEIAYVQQAQTPAEQNAVFAAVNDSKIRVFLASTAKGGVGMNVQRNLVALHHGDVPWRPADMEQREGRILRQGNENDEIEIVRYVTKKSFDEYRWGLLAQKQSSIVALMKGELTSMDDVDPAQLDMQVAQALASGDPRTLTMLNLERDVKALQTRYTAYARRLNVSRRAVKAGMDSIDQAHRARIGFEEQAEQAQTWDAGGAKLEMLLTTGRSGMLRGTTGAGVEFAMHDAESRKAFQVHIEEMLQSKPYEPEAHIAQAGPFEIRLMKGGYEKFEGGRATTTDSYYLSVATRIDGKQVQIGSTPMWIPGTDKFPQFARSLDTYLDPGRLVEVAGQHSARINRLEADIAGEKQIASKPFTQAEQLKAKESELAQLRTDLGVTRGVPKVAAADEGATFGQPDLEDDQPKQRGNIEFGKSKATGLTQTTINLFATADLSTFLHESGHLFLEVFGDLADQVKQTTTADTRTPEQNRLLEDWETTLEQLGVKARGEIGSAQHEQWAKSFEKYLEAGEAPSVELRSAFARFRAWLLAIYDKLRGRIDVSPELKGVFDRMLASEHEIATVEMDTPALFTTPEEAGMSPARFAIYQKQVEDAHRTTREQLDRQTAREVKREQTDRWKQQKAAVQADVTKEVMERHVYQALEAIRTGPPNEDGTRGEPLLMDRDALVAIVGEARVKELERPFEKKLTTRENGAEPEAVAHLVGYASADAMVKDIAAAPPAAAIIRDETARRMALEHGNMMMDGTLHDKARAAAANTDREALIRAEVAALWQRHEQSQRAYERRWLEAEAKLRIAIAHGAQQAVIDQLTAEVDLLKKTARGGPAAIRKALPDSFTLKALAAQRIAQTLIRDLKPSVFWTAARRASMQAIDLAAKQDLAGAAAAKLTQLTNLAYYAEASKVREEVDDSRKWVDDHDRDSARARLGKAGPSYLDQWDGILDRFEFKKVSQKVLDRRSSLAVWIGLQQAQGLPVVDLPAIVLDEVKRKNYSQLSVEQFMGVTDGLRQLVHLATLKNRLLRASATRDLAELTSDIGAHIREHNDEKPTPLEFTPKDEGHRRWSDFFASHAKIARLARALDGHQDAGPMWENVIRPINEAADAQIEQKTTAGDALAAILEKHYPGRELRNLQQKLDVPGVGSLSKEARIAVALNWGNEQNQDRILHDPRRQWTRRQVDAILDTLDRNDWEFVQASWDYIESFWPAIKAKQERVVGLAPEKVDAVAVETKFGTYKGGYYPLVYDGRLSLRAGQHEIAADLKLATLGNYVQATTRRGHTEARAQNVTLSVRLDLGVMFDHLEHVIHDLTHHEMLIDVSRILRSEAVQSAILETRGDLVYQQFSRALLDIAIDTMPARGVMEKAANWMRAGTQIAGLGFNLWTGLQQPLGVFNGARRVGPVWVAKGLKHWMTDRSRMEGTTKWVQAVSPMMRHRAATATQDLADLHSELRRPGGWFDALVRSVTGDRLSQQAITDSFLTHIELAQRLADYPTWLGQYEKSMAGGHEEARAIALADQAVLDSQGGGQMKDLAQVQRGTPLAKLFMTFYSYGSVVLNETADAWDAVEFRDPAKVGKFLGDLTLLYVMPAVATIALSRLVGRTVGSDDPEEGAIDFLQDVGKEVLSTAMNGWVFLREGTALLNEGTRGYEGPAGSRAFKLGFDLVNQVKQGKADAGLAKAANAAAGVVFKFPSAQAQRTVDGWIALEEGRTHNPLALLFGPPSKKRAK